MRHFPSSVLWGTLAVVVSVGCSQQAPPQPVPPRPPAAVAPEPARPAVVAAEPAQRETAQPDAAGRERQGPAAGSPAADPVAALQKVLAAAADDNARVVAIDALAQLGQNAKPALADLVRWSGAPDIRTRWHAARAIGMIGEDAISALPTLVKLVGDPDPIVATQSAAAIGLIRGDDGREAIPAEDARLYDAAVEALVGATTHSDARVRRAALRAVRRLRPAVKDLAPLVARQLADSDPSVVLPALHTLADMDEDAVPFLLESLADPKARYWASVALAEIGPEAAPAVESLARVAESGEVPERMQALLALASIGEKAAAAAPVMIKTLESGDDALKFPAAFALGSVRAADADAVLETVAHGQDAFLAEVAAWARARIHPQDKAIVADAVARLRRGLRGERANERRASASGLSDLAESLDEPTRRELAGDFAGLLADADPGVGMSGGAALIRLGASALETLRAKLADPQLRIAALEIMAALGPKAQPAVGDLIALLDDGDPTVRGEAALALAAVGPEAAAAVPALGKLLAAENVDPETRFSAAYALGRIGAAARPAVELLKRLSGSADNVLATVAMWATLKIAPEDKSMFEDAIPALRKAVRNDREIVRLEAVVALGDIGPPAASAIPILELASEDDSSRQVRAAAAEALRKIRGR